MPKHLIRNRLSVRQRTFASFVAVLIPCAVLAIVSILGTRAADRGMGHSRDMTLIAMRASEFATNVAALDAGVSRFALTGTAIDETAAGGQLVLVENTFEVSAQQQDVAIGDAGDLRAAFQRYEIAVKMIFEAVHERFAAADAVQRTSIELANATSAVITQLLRDGRTGALAGGVRLDEAMQSSLVAATRYFASQNPADADSAKSYLQNMRDEISGVAAIASEIPRLQPIADALPLLAKGYEAGIDEEIRATNSYRLATREHAEAVGQLGAIVSNLHQASRSARDQSLTDASRVLKVVMVVDIVTALVVLLSGMTVAHFASRSITAAREQAEALLSSLATMTQRLQSCTSDQEIGDVVSRFAPQIWPKAPGALYVLNNSGNALGVVATWNAPAELDEGFAPSECWALRRGRIHIVRDVDREVVCAHLNQHRVDSYSCVPLVAQGETLGLLYLETAPAPADGEATNGDGGHYIGVFAENIALALGDHRLRERLRNQSVRDPLTELFNRRFLEEALEINLSRAARSGTSVSVIMGDVDLFKRFNDRRGHDAGDFVLKRVAELIRANIRKGDLACRYGGEEFVLLLPGATLSEARGRAEMLRQAIKSTDMTFRDRPLGSVTMSLGVAAFPTNADDGKALITAADAAMYAAKRAGRDRVEVASGGGAGEAPGAEPKLVPRPEDQRTLPSDLPPVVASS
jgi:diguanylate cyclase (GGDEF)-like protein